MSEEGSLEESLLGEPSKGATLSEERSSGEGSSEPPRVAPPWVLSGSDLFVRGGWNVFSKRPLFEEEFDWATTFAGTWTESPKDKAKVNIVKRDEHLRQTITTVPSGRAKVPLSYPLLLPTEPVFSGKLESFLIQPQK